MSQGRRHNPTSMKYADIPGTYDRLLALYPLRPIHNDVELVDATATLTCWQGMS
jgi:hypothetical protein